MITVAILINGQPIMARSATNTGRRKSGKTAYRLDDGTTVYHDPDDGAVALAKMLLDSIKEVKNEGYEDE